MLKLCTTWFSFQEMLVGDCNETQCLLTAHEVCYPLKDEKGILSFYERKFIL